MNERLPGFQSGKRVLLLTSALILLFGSAALAQRVSGKVTAEDGAPIPGVNIIVDGTTVGTTTDSEGQYALDVTTANPVLVFSFIGYQTQTITVDNRTSVDVVLTPDIQTLGEVVVVGYGTQKKVNMTAAVSTISAEEVISRQAPNTISLLSYAESMFGSGQGADQRALDAFNAVRARPGVDMPPVTVLTTDNIRNERRVELAFEGLRFNDLKRWGIAHEIIPTIPGNGANVKRTFDGYVWPVPQSQMDIMEGVWQQNEGYN